MRRRLCAAILTFEAVVLGLTTPVLISVEDVDRALALWTGLGLMGLCLLTAGMLRREWAYGLGWLVQVAAVLLGFEITAMFVLGVVFLALWVAAYLLGGRIDDHQAAVARATEPLAAPAEVVAPESWQYELACTEETYRPFARERARELLRPRLLALPAACLLGGLLLVALNPGNGLVAGLLVAAAFAWPLIAWLAQRQAWRTFLRAGRTYRTSFQEDRLLVEDDGHLHEVEYAEITDVTEQHGLVSATLGERGVRLELPEPVFPPAAVDRVRRHIAARGPR